MQRFQLSSHHHDPDDLLLFYVKKLGRGGGHVEDVDAPAAAGRFPGLAGCSRAIPANIIREELIPSTNTFHTIKKYWSIQHDCMGPVYNLINI